MKLKELLFNQTAFLQSLGVVVYCSLIGLLFWKGEEIFGKPNPYMRYLGPVMFLVLFIFSALICASFVFYQPYKLFFEGKKKEAAHLVIATTAWLFIFFNLFFYLTVYLQAM